jgi:hypothetical protein
MTYHTPLVWDPKNISFLKRRKWKMRFFFSNWAQQTPTTQWDSDHETDAIQMPLKDILSRHLRTSARYGILFTSEWPVNH